MAVQTMDWTVYSRPECKRANNTCHTPTYGEVRSMSWQSIALGSNGVFFDSIDDLAKDTHFTQPQGWARLSAVAREIQRFAPVLLARRAAAGGVVLVAAGTPPPSWLLGRGRKQHGLLCFRGERRHGRRAGHAGRDGRSGPEAAGRDGGERAAGAGADGLAIAEQLPLCDGAAGCDVVLRVQFRSAAGGKSDDVAVECSTRARQLDYYVVERAAESANIV
jgi:hypothetical protein